MPRANGSTGSSPGVVASSGLAALALAMGIGRFAFTPILPMMQEDAGISVVQGALLASANYLGYLLGGLSAMRGGLGQRFAIRFGLLAIAVTTLAMGFADSFAAWIVLRALSGLASAWVLVFVSAWSLERLGKARRADLTGIVYAGVGSGIVFAGLACLALSRARLPSSAAWEALGIAALLFTIGLWRVVGGEAKAGGDPKTGSDAKAAVSAPALPASPRDIPEFWRLVLCYGAFGFAYIIPATFLPVMAKQAVSDPLWFGWAWPVFGAAAVVSTLLAARLTQSIGYRSVWILGNLVMAAGVLVPIVVPGLTGIVIAAVCVGGTFMVNTMVGLQEARRVAGVHARILMAAMTSSFALGQIAGPLLAGAFMDVNGRFTAALAASAIPLFLAAYALWRKPCVPFPL